MFYECEYEMETGMNFRNCGIGTILAYNDWDIRIEMGSRKNPGIEINQGEQVVRALIE